MSMAEYQTVKRDSIFTRVDFRPKLVVILVITIVAFVWESVLMNGALAAVIVVACFLAGVRWGFIRLAFSIMIPFSLILILSHGFLNEAQLYAYGTPRVVFSFPDNWPLIGGANLWFEGLLYGLSLSLKSIALMLIIPLGIFTTEVNNLIVGLVRARIPYKIAFIFSSTLRFVPLLFSEIQAIIEAQRLRGLALEKMGFLKRLRVYAKVAIPLILCSIVKSQQLEVVLQAKAFSGNANRTYLHESILRPVDKAVIAGSLVFLVLAIVGYVGWGIGKFGGPI
jgi:energy-coupling factor transport system permease protein